MITKAALDIKKFNVNELDELDDTKTQQSVSYSSDSFKTETDIALTSVSPYSPKKYMMVKKGTIDLHRDITDQTPIIYTEITTPSSIGGTHLLSIKKQKPPFGLKTLGLPTPMSSELVSIQD